MSDNRLVEKESKDQHLTVVLSGAVSMGSFHAGCVAQVGWFLSRWAEEADKDPSLPRIMVDVVGGASAGAMTGAMLSHFIGSGYYETLHGAGKDDSERRTTFVQKNFDTWCGDGLAYAKLVKGGDSEERTSFLSNSVLEEIAEKAMPDTEPALPKGQEQLIYTCTLTSMDGISMSVKLPDATVGRNLSMPGTTRRDFVTFYIVKEGRLPNRFKPNGRILNDSWTYGDTVFMELASERNEGSEPARTRLWTRFRYSCLSSGAFPFAWDPLVMSRWLQFYPSEAVADDPVKKDPKGKPEKMKVGRFKYMDGGVIDNMPLGRAAKVFRSFTMHDPKAERVDTRTYVLIGTKPKGLARPTIPAVGERESAGPWRDSEFGMPKVVMPMFEAMREQSFFEDLATAAGINDNLKDREKELWSRLDRYVDLLSDEDVSAELEKLSKEADKDVRFAVAQELVSGASADEPGAKEFRTHALDQGAKDSHVAMMRQYSPTEDGGGEDQRERLKLYLRIMSDKWTGLYGKHKLNVLAVNPAVELQSQFMGAFGGFLDRSYMAGDFLHGMLQTQAQLRAYVEGLCGAKGKAAIERVFADASGLVPVVEGFYGDANFWKSSAGYYDPTERWVDGVLVHPKARSLDDVSKDGVQTFTNQTTSRGVAFLTMAFPKLVGNLTKVAKVAWLADYVASGIFLLFLFAVWMVTKEDALPTGTKVVLVVCLLPVLVLACGMSIGYRKLRPWIQTLIR